MSKQVPHPVKILIHTLEEVKHNGNRWRLLLKEGALEYELKYESVTPPERWKEADREIIEAEHALQAARREYPEGAPEREVIARHLFELVAKAIEAAERRMLAAITSANDLMTPADKYARHLGQYRNHPLDAWASSGRAELNKLAGEVDKDGEGIFRPDESEPLSAKLGTGPVGPWKISLSWLEGLIAMGGFNFETPH